MGKSYEDIKARHASQMQSEYITEETEDMGYLLAALDAVNEVAEDLMTRGLAIEEKHERNGNGSLYSHRATGRGIGYREAARNTLTAINNALEG